MVKKRLSSIFVLSVLGVISCSGPSQEVRTPAPPPSRIAEPGTLETLAGPSFCPTESIVRKDAGEVRALAVAPDGGFWFETGPVASPLLGRVDPTGAASVGPQPASVARASKAFGSAPERTPGSRMTFDGREAVLATDSAIFLVGRGVSLLAGEASGREPPGRTPEGEGVPLGQARFAKIESLAADSAGNLFVADRRPGRAAGVSIRFLNRGTTPVRINPGTPAELHVPPGQIRTIAGAGSSLAGPGSVGGRFLKGSPPALATDGRLLYIASREKSAGTPPTTRVAVINLGGDALSIHDATARPGAVTFVAGGRSGYGGDGGPGSSARFSLITGMSVTQGGDLYLADQLNHRIRRLDAGGRVSTVAGSGPPGTRRGESRRNEAGATTAKLDRPSDVESGPGGLYVADTGNGRILLLDDSGKIRSLPGKGVAPTIECRGRQEAGGATPSETAVPGAPAGLAAGHGGSVFFSDRVGGRVRRIDPSGRVGAVAGTGPVVRNCGISTACPQPEFQSPAKAQLPGPSRLASIPHGLYILDAVDSRVRFVNLGSRPLRVHGKQVPPGTITTVAGDGTLGSSGDGGEAVSAQIDPDQASIAADRSGNLYLSDPTHRKLRMVDRNGRISSLLSPESPAPGGCCKHPVDIEGDAEGNLLISETIEPRIWFLNRRQTNMKIFGQTVLPGEAVSIAGNGKTGAEGDGGSALDASLGDPVGLALDGRGNIYIADRAAHSVRRIDAGGRITTIAGTGQTGFNGDGLKGSLTRLSEPGDVAVDGCGNLLIADSGNGRVRRLALAASCRATYRR